MAVKSRSKLTCRRQLRGFLLHVLLLLVLNLFLCVIARRPQPIIIATAVELLLVSFLKLAIPKLPIKILAGCGYFLITLQSLVSYIAGSYLTLSMITSVLNPTGKVSLVLWIAGGLLLGILCFFPVKIPHLFKSYKLPVSLFLIGTLSLFFLNTPLKSLAALGIERLSMEQSAARIRNDDSVSYDQFYQEGIQGGIDIDASAPKNVIVLFTEGLSAEVLDVNNSLRSDLTPNLTTFEKESISFKNYYNHTASTGRGIRGQLYSGYQNFVGHEKDIPADDIPARYETPFISLTTILSEAGYQTEFIQSPTKNKHFSNFMGTLGFDTLKQSPRDDAGKQDDAMEFRLLLSDAELMHVNGERFFMGMYNFQTHHGVDVKKDRYGDGSNPLLNKFHHYDVNFAKFLAAFRASPIYEDTLLIFTADHATYPDGEYRNTFQSDQEYFIGEIPLMIYGKGVQPQVIDAGGRNSLALAPTILDLLAMEETPNYFLGTSLFVDDPQPQEYYAAEGTSFYDTDEGVTQIHQTDPTIEKILEYMKYSDQ